MEIQLTSTENTFDMSGTLVRAWKGTTKGGGEVVALIAAIRTSEEILDLTPIPPPDQRWSPAVREAMGTLWQMAHAMSDWQARSVVEFAGTLMSHSPDGKGRHP